MENNRQHTAQSGVIADLRQRINKAISSRRITEALNLLRTLASATSAPWQMTEDTERLRRDYDNMSAYALNGINDPEREIVYSQLVNDINSLADSMVRLSKVRDTSTLYFDIVRTDALHPERDIAGIYTQLEQINNNIAMATFSGAKIEVAMLREREALQIELFRKIWTTHPLKSADIDSLRQIINSENTPLHQRRHILSAIMLGALAYRDDRRLMLLLDTYTQFAQSDVPTAIRALVALVIAMWQHRGNKPGRKLLQRLASAAETEHWARDVKSVSLALLQTRDTADITRTISEDVIPSMLKLRPDIYKKINDSAPIDETSLADVNPEWEEMLEKSGLTDKLRQLSEMQEQGADVMMATFSHLKGYPFFNEIANWFLPYYDEHSAVADTRASDGGDTAVEIVSSATFMCDSDRYSMLFSINTIPQAQRRVMIQQFEQQSLEMAAAKAADIDAESTHRERSAINFIRDIYRFFNLFRRKGEFDGTFFERFNPMDIPTIREAFTDDDSKAIVAEFLFSHKHWADALAAFKVLAQHSDTPSPQVYQKIGFAAQKLGDYRTAVDNYQQAELLDPDNKWTWRRLAVCLRFIGRPNDALQYYRRILKDSPDDLNLTLQMANTLTECGNFAEALKLYYKVEYLDSSKKERVERSIAWCAFMVADYETSRKYYHRVIAGKYTPADFVNLGHLEMATGNYHDALAMYRLALESKGYTKADFAKAMQEDLKHLRAAGVDDLITGIVIDKLLAS